MRSISPQKKKVDQSRRKCREGIKLIEKGDNKMKDMKFSRKSLNCEEKENEQTKNQTGYAEYDASAGGPPA